MKSLAVAAAVAAVLALGVVSGAALADGHHGNKHDDSAQALLTTVTVDTSPGVKPSDTTKHDTSCTTGGGQGASATCSSTTSTNADASKRYGNGRTAAQIANGHGAPAGTQVKGPGNSQPHKVCRNGHWVDVHAAKSYDQSGCTTTTAAATTTVGTTTTLAAAATTLAATTTTLATTTTTLAAATTTTVAQTANTSAPPTGGVLGASKVLKAPSHPSSGVLGTAKTLGSGTLPFTGLRLWIVELVAFGLIGGGVALRLIARRRTS
jgi:hypothetical protein